MNSTFTQIFIFGTHTYTTLYETDHHLYSMAHGSKDDERLI